MNPQLKSLSVKETAELAGSCPRTIWRLIRKGKLKAYKLGRVYRIDLKDWEAYKNSRAVGAGESRRPALRWQDLGGHAKRLWGDICGRHRPEYAEGSHRAVVEP